MGKGKREMPDFVPGKVTPDTDPTDNYQSPVDIGQDFTQAAITTDPVVPTEQ